MNSFRFAALSAALCCLFALPARADLNVVATLPDLAAISKSVGGDHATVTTLALPSGVAPSKKVAFPVGVAEPEAAATIACKVTFCPERLCAIEALTVTLLRPWPTVRAAAWADEPAATLWSPL